MYSLTICILISCDAGGNVIITNGYPHGILVYIEAEYKGEKHEKLVQLDSNDNYAPAAMGHIEYNYIKKIRIETEGKEFLTEYSPECISQIRNIYVKKKNQAEVWVLTKRGLFFKTLEISRKFNFNSKAVNDYYSSDEAVQELEEKLKEWRERKGD